MNVGRRILTAFGRVLLSSSGARKIGTIADCCCGTFCCVYVWTATQFGVTGGGTCRSIGRNEDDVDWYYGPNACTKYKIDVACEPACSTSGDCTASAPTAPSLPCCGAECEDGGFFVDECDECQAGSPECVRTYSVSFSWTAAIPTPDDGALYTNYLAYQACLEGRTFNLTDDTGGALCQGTHAYEQAFPSTGCEWVTVSASSTVPSGTVPCSTSGSATFDSAEVGGFVSGGFVTASGSAGIQISGDYLSSCTAIRDTTTDPNGDPIEFRCCVDAIP
jgi:hypothetical protein